MRNKNLDYPQVLVFRAMQDIVFCTICMTEMNPSYPEVLGIWGNTIRLTYVGKQAFSAVPILVDLSISYICLGERNVRKKS